MTTNCSRLLWCCIWGLNTHVSVFAFTSGGIRNKVSYRERKADDTTLHLDGEGMAGATFNKHILGDVLRALQPGYLSQMKESIAGNIKAPTELQLDPLQTFVDKSGKDIPSWENLENMLRSQQTPGEKSFRDRLEEGLEHSALAKKRDFPNTPVSVTFYKDAASWCPYCQKVWIALEEKQIPYNVVKVDMNCYAGRSKPSDFLKIQPSGSLPCVVFNDGSKETVVAESDDILAVIDKFNPASKGTDLLPEIDSEEMEYMKFLCDDGRNSLERRLYAEWMWYLTGKRKPVEYRERYSAMLDEVESVLADSSGPFFTGKEISMADIKFIPFLERQIATLLYYKGFIVRDESKWPNICKWIQEMEKRPSYQATKSDVYTHTRALPPQISAECIFAPDKGFVESKNAIDAYCLPTITKAAPQDLLWRESDWEQLTKTHRKEAAERIIFNRDSIVKFASRAAGKPGLPAAAAPLADPRATSNDVAQLAVDIFLRLTIQRLLQKDAFLFTKKDLLKEAGAALAMGSEDTTLTIVDCLDYLRQRIGVPRDMSYPAAQELRAELLHVSTLIESESAVLALAETSLLN